MSNKPTVTLPPYKIDSICKAWGDYKYTNVFEFIAYNPDALTHDIMRSVPCNNVPDNAAIINKRLKKHGLAVICNPLPGKSRNASSHQWHLVEVEK